MPANKNPHRIFYGWWVVGACFFISLYVGGVIHFGFTAVFEPIADEFGWSYAQISLAASLRGLETGLLAPLLGFMVDRWGARRLLLVGMSVGGFGLILLSRVNSLGMFYGAFLLIAVGTSACSATVFLTAVANWFRRKVSIATGITASGLALGGILVPMVSALIDTFGWREAMVYLGFGMWIICLPLALFIRHKPEQYGWLPDGDMGSKLLGSEGMASAFGPDIDIPARQALRTRAFWYIALAFMYQMLVTNAVIVHVMPYLSNIGISRSAASMVASAVPVASIGGRLGFGWFGDRLNKRHMAAACFVCTGLGLASFAGAAAGMTWLLVPFLILFGTGWGGAVTMRVGLLRDTFGRKRFGTIHGFTLGIVMVGNLTGPPIAGWAFDNWGTYQGIWFAFACLSIVSIVLAVTIPRVASATRPVGKS